MRRIFKKIARQYFISWRHIKESKNYIFLTILLFLFGIGISLIYRPAIIVDLIKNFIERVVQDTQGLNLWGMIVYILNNNLRSCFFSMIFGIFLGIFPIFTVLSNGYVLGFVAEKAVGLEGMPVLLRLFPHGIFEFPAVIISIALGLKLGFFWFSKNKKKGFLENIENSLRAFLFIILPLLIIAAIMEGILIIVLD